jgi:hypothetical protein
VSIKKDLTYTLLAFWKKTDRENNMEYGMKKVQQIYMQHSNSSTELITWMTSPNIGVYIFDLNVQRIWTNSISLDMPMGRMRKEGV